MGTNPIPKELNTIERKPMRIFPKYYYVIGYGCGEEERSSTAGELG